MPELILNPEQSKLVATAGVPMLVRDASGRDVGDLTPTCPADEAPLSVTPDEVEELSRRGTDAANGDWPTTQEMLARLKSRAAS